jgi:serine protease inhibitor
MCKFGMLKRLPLMHTYRVSAQLHRALRLASVLAVSVSFTFRAAAQANTGFGSIVGTISDSSVGPLMGLDVYTLEGGHGESTDGQGGFVLDSVPAGEVNLIVSGRNYNQLIRGIRVIAGTRTRADRWIRPYGYESPERLLNRTDSSASGAYASLDTTNVVSYARFSIDLFRSLAADSPESNVFISPSSAAFVLSMIAGGASGRTWTQMSSVLGVERSTRERLGQLNAAELSSLASQNGVVLDIGNSLWAAEDIPFSPSFLSQARSSYHAEVHTQILHGSKTRDAINNWASTATKGRIQAVLSDTLPDTTRMVVLNAVYFKGKWLDPFDSSATVEKAFALASAPAAQRKFMARQGEMLYAADSGIRIVRLPYQGGRVAMYIVLPDSTTKLPSVIERLTSNRWTRWMRTLTARDVHLELPRFHLESDASFSKPLRSMGMTAAFDCDSADFTRMFSARHAGNPHACISQVDQRAFVEVNEVGTEAAAVTMAFVLSPTGIEVRPPPIEFIVNRPFIVAIRDDRTGLLLFLGQITDPKQQP